MDCNTCRCVDGNELMCTKETCISINVEDLPEINDGEACEPFKTYRIDCNVCRCTPDNGLVCTEKTCASDQRRVGHEKLNTKGKEKTQNKDRHDIQHPCVPNKTYKHRCNTCLCINGTLICTQKHCGSKIYKESLSEIKYGKPCQPNEKYRMGCNICRCTHNKELLCTAKACRSQNQSHQKIRKLEPVEKLKHKENLNKDIEDAKDLKLHKQIMRQNKNQSEVNKLPDLPEGPCVPGKFYQKDCYGCYCEVTKVAVCSQKKNACEPNRPSQFPLGVRPPFTKEELAGLPSLPNAASRCEPGRAYKVSCNTCLCLSTYSLICDHLLCLSSDDMNRLEAHKKSGHPCKKDSDTVTTPCVFCSCVDGKSQCSYRIGCLLPDTLRARDGQYEKVQPMLTMDVDKQEKCLPETVYKDDCNKCYCQDDGTLRCTMKVCLNYVESLRLKKHRLYLKKHGL